MTKTQPITQTFTDILTKRISTDRLSLPAFPPMASKCLALMKEKEYDQRQLIALLQKDPVLTAQVVRLASSAAYGSGEPLRSIEQAVTRLGSRNIKTAIIEACARQVYQSTDSHIALAFAELWRHALAVAMLARDVAAIIGRTDAEFAYLGGLLHDIGKPVTAIILLEAEKALGNSRWVKSEEWIQVVNESHRPIGVLLATKWKLPDEVRKTISDCSEYDTSERTSIANVVRFANSVAKREKIYTGPYDAEDVDALIMIGRSLLGIDEEHLDKLAHNLGQRVSSEML